MIIPVSLAALRARITESENLASFLDVFRTAGFAVDRWRAGGAFVTLARALARGLTTGTGLVRGLAEGSFLDLASGDWLTLLAASWFRLQRRPASYAEHTITLHNGPGSVPYTVVPGQVWVSTSATPGAGHRFRNTGAGPLPASSELALTFRAEQPGAAYNVEPGTPLVMVTSLPGVTPHLTALVTAGLDEETDEELRTRCRSRWATLAPEHCMPGAGWEFWALTMPDGVTARDGVTRAYCDIDNPDGPGTLTVYLAGPAGAVTEDVRTAVDADLQALEVPGAVVTVASAVEHPVSLTGEVWIVPGVEDTPAAVRAALNALLAKMPIGGRTIGNVSGIFRDELEQALRAVPGVARATITSAPIALAPHEIAVAADSAWPGIVIS